jgi:hypothetical protein
MVFQSEGAAGSIYADIPTVITAINNGRNQFYAGCFVTRLSNVPVGNATTPDPNWHFYSATIATVNSLNTGLENVGEGCQ